jgi:vancomycin resistance protein YoaR
MNQVSEKISDIIAGIKEVITKKKEQAKKRRLIAILTVFFIVIVIVAFVAIPIYAYETIYQDKIYPGVYIDGINVGSLTNEEAINKLNQHIDNLDHRGLNFNYENKKYHIGLTVVSPDDPDLAFPILDFKTDQMIKQAYVYGRNDNLAFNLFNQLKSLLNKKELALDYDLNEKELRNILKEHYKDYEKPSTNPQIKFLGDKDFKILPETRGFEINYDKVVTDLKQEINLIAINALNLQTVATPPDLVKAEAEILRPMILQVLNNEKITFEYNDKKWEILTDEFKNWLGFDKVNNKAVVIFQKELMADKLNLIAQEINIAPQNAKFVFTDGKVAEFQPSANGLELDIESSALKINQEFFKNQQVEISMNVIESEPMVKTGDVNDMGIKELVGVGQSDFAGSSYNRVRNITNAANHLNGVLIKPDEEFSLVEAIGDVTAATGYFPEYVIKGDRTIPEYGGGLCQIATTVFRAALYSGLPITERKNHSYMVSYYYPNGMDATIYGPHPDLRFKNDTGYNILIQTRIEGTFIYFEFWGTSDGRSVELTDPETYNWRGAGEPRYIENPDLPPGEKKLLEHARRGADAHFYRYISRPGQEKEEEVWRSHYGAWRAIYEIGVAPVVEEEAEAPADVVTEENINQPAE